MAVSLTAVFALLLLLVSPVQCQELESKFTASEHGVDPLGADVQGDMKGVDGENLVPAALWNKDWPGATDDLRKMGDHEERACEIISVTEEPAATPQPTETPAGPHSQPVLPPVPVIPLIPNSRYPVLLPGGGAVVPAQSVGSWFVPVEGLYPRVQVLLYPSGQLQYYLGQVPLTYGRNPWILKKPHLPANTNPIHSFWGVSHRKRRKSSEEHD